MEWKLFKEKLSGFFKRENQAPGRKKYKFFLCLDIGTESVKAFISGVSEPDKKIAVFANGLGYYDGLKISLDKNFETEIMKKAVSLAVGNAYSDLSLSLLEKELKKKIQKQKKLPVLLGLPPDILKAKIVSQSFFREKPKAKISEREENFICRQISENAKIEISRKFAEDSGILVNGINWTYFKIYKIKVDGYLVSDLKGYQGKELEFKVLATFLPNSYLEKIQKIINSLGFKIFKIVHLAEGLSVFCRAKKRNGVFFDIGGEITQIFKIKNSRLEQIDNFKGGARIFIDNLSQRLGVDKETARDFGERYSRKILSPEARERVKDILSESRRVWQNSLKAKLAKINPKDIYPSIIFLFGGGSCFPEILEALTEKGNIEDNYSVFNRSRIRFIRLRDLERINDLTKKLDNPQYVSSLLLTLTL